MSLAAALETQRRCFASSIGKHNRAEDRALEQERDLGEIGSQLGLELCLSELSDMKRIRRGFGWRIVVTIRRAGDEQSARPKHAPDLAQEAPLFGQALNRFEGSDNIEGGVGARQKARVAHK